MLTNHEVGSIAIQRSFDSFCCFVHVLPTWDSSRFFCFFPLPKNTHMIPCDDLRIYSESTHQDKAITEDK